MHCRMDAVCRTGDLEAGRIPGFEERGKDLLGGAGVGSAFEDDELAVVNVRGNGLDGADDKAEVGLVMVVERGGDADDHRIH